MPKAYELVGRFFYRLTVLSKLPSSKGVTHWECKCTCGTIKSVRGSDLVNGKTKSCGCLNREVASRQGKLNTRGPVTHGYSKTSTYSIWMGMRTRCNNPKALYFKDYGGRGITVCERWSKFENFLADMGERPGNLQIDREDNNGNYEPGNVRWVTCSVNGRNKRDTRFLTVDGVTKCLAEWAEVKKINAAVILKRILHGWSVENAVMQPLRSKRDKRVDFSHDPGRMLINAARAGTAAGKPDDRLPSARAAGP